MKRSGDERYPEVTDRKRSSGNDTRFEAPPPPRFDAALVQSRRLVIRELEFLFIESKLSFKSAAMIKNVMTTVVPLHLNVL